MPKQGRKATVKLKAPIGLGDKSELVGYVTEHDESGTRIFDRQNGTGKSQWFPGHLVESVEFEDQTNKEEFQ